MIARSNVGTDIRYSQGNGELHFDYVEEVVFPPDKRNRRAFRCYRISGIVPKDIVKQGEGAIKRYAEERVREELNGQKEKDRQFDERIKKTDIPIAIMHEEVHLNGRILWSEEENGVVVRIEEPFIDQTYWGYAESFGAAMAGYKKFEKSDVLTAHAREDAERRLIEMYEKKQPGSISNLVERLNTKK